jgi:hypothetical protein
MYYSVVAHSGAGPYTITVDRPIREPFVTNDMVLTVSSVPTDILLEGNGATITGTGDRYIELPGAHRCLVTGWRMDASGGELGAAGAYASFDIGARQSTFRDCVVDGGSGMSSGSGILLESAEDCTIENCHAIDVGTNAAGSSIGFGLWDCWGCSVVNSHAAGCYYGVYMGSDGAYYGCVDCSVQGGTFVGCNTGVNLSGVRPTAIGAEASYCTTYGFACVSGGPADCKAATLFATSSHHNGKGYYVAALATGTCGGALRAQNSTTYDMHLEGECYIDGFFVPDCTSAKSIYGNGSPVIAHLSNVRIVGNASAGAQNLIEFITAAELHLKTARLTGANGSSGGIVANTGGVKLYLDDVKYTGTGTGLELFAASVTRMDQKTVGISTWFADASAMANFQAAVPTHGAWAVGEQIWNNAPAAGAAAGWICTVAGSPGTWVAMANLA